MKISELISHCEKALKENGDLEIKISDTESQGDDSTSPLAGVITIMNDEKTPAYFLICDDATVDMFGSHNEEDEESSDEEGYF